MPRRSISALRWRRSLVRSARQAANAVPSWHMAHTAPAFRTIFLKSSLVKPKTFVCFSPSLATSSLVGMG